MDKEEIRHLSQSYYDLHEKYYKLQWKCKKQKEVIDKIKNVQIKMPKSTFSYDYMIYRSKIDEILKEVSK